MNESSTESATTASNLPGVSATLSLLRDLGDTVHRLSERSASVEREHLVQSTRLRRLLEEQTGTLAAELSTALQEVQTAHLSARSESERRHDLRKTHIKKAQERARASQFKAIEEFEGKRKFEIQREQLQATRRRDEAIQAERHRLEAFNAALTAERDALAAFEGRAISTLSGYPAFQRQEHLVQRDQGAGIEQRVIPPAHFLAPSTRR